jgi:hypothetical protein
LKKEFLSCQMDNHENHHFPSWKQRMENNHMDIKTNFMNNEFTKDEFTQQPWKVIQPNYENLVCKLHVALYGLNKLQKQGIKSYIHKALWKIIKMETTCIISKSYIKFFFAKYDNDILIARWLSNKPILGWYH